MSFEEVKKWLITEADMDQLKEVTNLAVMRKNALGVAQVLSFAPGEPVWFDARNKGIIKGKFMILNRKNAKVQAESGMVWTVSPALLHKGTP
jgi:hypothetical protein